MTPNERKFRVAFRSGVKAFREGSVTPELGPENTLAFRAGYKAGFLAASSGLELDVDRDYLDWIQSTR